MKYVVNKVVSYAYNYTVDVPDDIASDDAEDYCVDEDPFLNRIADENGFDILEEQLMDIAEIKE